MTAEPKKNLRGSTRAKTNPSRSAAVGKSRAAKRSPGAPAQTEWTIEKLVPGGAGFVRLRDGRTGFADGALPGERISVSAADDRKSYLVARSFELLEPSASRVEPPCPIARACGGCDWMHLELAAQRRAKLALVREALERTGGFRELPEIQLTVGSAEHYRGRLRLHIDAAGRIGFFGRQSHTLVEVESCLVANSQINAAIRRLREIAVQHPAALATFTEAEFRVAPEPPKLALRLFPRDNADWRNAEELIAALEREFLISIAGKRSREPVDQRWPLPGGVTLHAPPEAFTQVNWEINLELTLALLEGAKRRQAESFCDLYCGAGNFSLPLFKAGLRGMAIEVSEDAVHAARRAAAAQGLSEARFVSGDAHKILQASVERRDQFDLLVLDPPRAGAKSVIAAVTALRPKFIACCACDPVTLARDLRQLTDAGYAIEELRAFDMFPHTHHVELLVWLRALPNV